MFKFHCRALCVLALSTGLGSAAYGDDALPDYCQPGVPVEYPLGDMLRATAADLMDSDALQHAIDPGNVPDFLPPEDQKVERQARQDAYEMDEQMTAEMLGQLKMMSQNAHDAMILTAIDHYTFGDDPLLSFVLSVKPVLRDAYIDVLDRNGFTEEADLIRETLDIFGPVSSPYDRYFMLYDRETQNPINPELRARLAVQSAAWNKLNPSFGGKAEMLAREDPGFTAELLSRVPTRRMVSYLSIAMDDCGGKWRDQIAAGDPYAELTQPRQDLGRLGLFMVEVSFTSVEDYLTRNEASAGLPELVDTFQRVGLSEHADAYGQVLKMFGPSYPRDLDARLAAFERMPRRAKARLQPMNDLTKDPAIIATMKAIALEGDVMPDLQYSRDE